MHSVKCSSPPGVSDVQTDSIHSISSFGLIHVNVVNLSSFDTLCKIWRQFPCETFTVPLQFMQVNAINAIYMSIPPSSHSQKFTKMLHTRHKRFYNSQSPKELHPHLNLIRACYTITKQGCRVSMNAPVSTVHAHTLIT